MNNIWREVSGITRILRYNAIVIRLKDIFVNGFFKMHNNMHFNMHIKGIKKYEKMDS